METKIQMQAHDDTTLPFLPNSTRIKRILTRNKCTLCRLRLFLEATIDLMGRPLRVPTRIRMSQLSNPLMKIGYNNYILTPQF